MYSTRHVNIEVFRDIDTPEAPIDGIITGLEELKQIVPYINVIARNGMYKICQSRDETVRSNEPAALRIPSDFAVIATTRQLELIDADAPKIRKGDAVMGLAQVAARYSVISSARLRDPAATAKHELGHLFHLKTTGNHNKSGHCSCETCLMKPVYNPEHTEYCNECSEHFAQTGFKILRRKYELYPTIIL